MDIVTVTAWVGERVAGAISFKADHVRNVRADMMEKASKLLYKATKPLKKKDLKFTVAGPIEDRDVDWILKNL